MYVDLWGTKIMLSKQINADIKQAMINKDKLRVTVLRTIVAEFKNEAINLKKKDDGLTDEEALKVIKREAKKHKDSITQYRVADREDLVEQEQTELDIIQKYLPEEMSEENVAKIVDEVLVKMGEVLPSQFGEVVKKVMVETKGQADGSTVSKIVKEKLGK